MIPLQEGQRRLIGYVLGVMTGIFVVWSLVLSLEDGDLSQSLENMLFGIAFISVSVVSVRAAPRNGAGWALLWFAIVGSLDELINQLLARRDLSPEAIRDLSPASLTVPEALAVSFGAWGWLWLMALLVYLIVLFPEGRATSMVRRLLFWSATAVVATASIISAVELAPWVDTRYGQSFSEDAFIAAVSNGFVAVVVIVSLSLVDLILRFKRSEGVERLRFKWVASALLLFALSIVLSFPLYAVGIELSDLFTSVALMAVPVSVGVAITKYRLFDIDLVLSRMLMFLVLVGFITLLHASVVVGLGSLAGGASMGWQIAATALVAVVFEPVRERVQRWINRLVFGRRASPYEVLSDLTGRLAATEGEEGVFERMAARLAEGTGADRAIVWVKDGESLRAVASEPACEDTVQVAADLAALPGTAVPIRHDGEMLGALSVESRRGDGMTPTELRLVRDLAGSAGLLIRRFRLDAALSRKANELEESRRRMVGAQDVERRRLERELNEGPQRRVAELKLQLSLVGQRSRAEGALQLAAMIGQMEAETQDAIEQIQALARGIYPPLLEAEGLCAAVRALGGSMAAAVTVRAELCRRYPVAAEAAIYFCVSEALTNAVKHGRPPIQVHVSDASGELSFTVSDSGPGFDPVSVVRGAGLDNMVDRLDAFDGAVTIDSEPGRSTTVSGRLPLRLLEVPA